MSDKIAALSMDEAKKKLAELERYLPKAPSDLTYEFGRFLAGRLNPQLVPAGFVMACELALYDLAQGIDGFTKKPVPSNLVGYPPMIYALLRMDIVPIAKAIFPAEFAAGVEQFINEVNEKMKKASAKS